jgi:hypothetical protein
MDSVAKDRGSSGFNRIGKGSAAFGLISLYDWAKVASKGRSHWLDGGMLLCRGSQHGVCAVTAGFLSLGKTWGVRFEPCLST